MPAYVGSLLFDYFVEKNNRHIFTVSEAIAEGAQIFGRLNGKALLIAKDVSAFCTAVQKGYDLPATLKSCKKLYDEFPKTEHLLPAICDAISYLTWLIGVTQYLWDKNLKSYTKPIGAAADLVRDAYEFYHERHKFSLSLEGISTFCQKISLIVSTLLSLSSFYAGVENRHPYLSLALTTIYLSAEVSLYDLKRAEQKAAALPSQNSAPHPFSGVLNELAARALNSSAVPHSDRSFPGRRSNDSPTSSEIGARHSILQEFRDRIAEVKGLLQEQKGFEIFSQFSAIIGDLQSRAKTDSKNPEISMLLAKCYHERSALTLDHMTLGTGHDSESALQHLDNGIKLLAKSPLSVEKKCDLLEEIRSLYDINRSLKEDTKLQRMQACNEVSNLILIQDIHKQISEGKLETVNERVGSFLNLKENTLTLIQKVLLLDAIVKFIQKYSYIPQWGIKLPRLIEEIKNSKVVGPDRQNIIMVVKAFRASLSEHFKLHGTLDALCKECLGEEEPRSLPATTSSVRGYIVTTLALSALALLAFADIKWRPRAG